MPRRIVGAEIQSKRHERIFSGRRNVNRAQGQCRTMRAYAKDIRYVFTQSAVHCV